MTGQPVYGRNPVRELAAAGRREVHAVYALPELAREPWLVGLGAEPRSRAELGRLAGSAEHQGVVALAGPYPYADAGELLRAEGPIVCLDRVQDPRNLGAVARVVDAAGAAGIVVPERGSAPVTGAVARASAGAVEHVAVARVPNLAGFLHDARGPERWVVGADAEDGDDYREAGLGLDTILVLGAEGAGLRPRVRSMCDRFVHIPMHGRVASLNVSVAAAVLLFDIAEVR